jgi:hypothetical protein
VLVAPATPARCFLRKAEIVDQEERSRTGTDERLQFRLGRLEVVSSGVEPARQARVSERLDFRSVVVGRDENLVGRLEADRTDAMPECVPTEGEEPTTILLERERKVASATEVHTQWERRPGVEPRLADETSRPAEGKVSTPQRLRHRLVLSGGNRKPLTAKESMAIFV